ncbi:hypothetical protein Lepto7375DRAFT_3817 [Leptolyngbya sp. PCC 7375]|nr:hypothetical protein Lepto7375DRAFT_3817 [Leptolyngbya sp. PCC 7375]
MVASVKHVHVPDTCDRIAIFRQLSHPQGFWFTVTQAMRSERLPQEFSDSLEQGIWTTCAEILPAAEKAVRPRVMT